MVPLKVTLEVGGPAGPEDISKLTSTHGIRS
jgi:hypothetical protein